MFAKRPYLLRPFFVIFYKKLHNVKFLHKGTVQIRALIYSKDRPLNKYNSILSK